MNIVTDILHVHIHATVADVRHCWDW